MLKIVSLVLALALTLAAAVNVNTASKEELQTISGVGPVTAERIIEYRQSNGKFETKEDLTNVRGIGTNTLEKIKNDVEL
ncbi:MAG: ComEA family DNA-binding protein [Campylobacterota bacterium]